MDRSLTAASSSKRWFAVLLCWNQGIKAPAKLPAEFHAAQYRPAARNSRSNAESFLDKGR